MGVSKQVCSANKVEIRKLNSKIRRMSKWKYDYPGQLTPTRRMDFTVSMNEMSERVEYLRRDKHANIRRELAEDEESDYNFTYVFKKSRVKNRKK